VSSLPPRSENNTWRSILPNLWDKIQSFLPKNVHKPNKRFLKKNLRGLSCSNTWILPLRWWNIIQHSWSIHAKRGTWVRVWGLSSRQWEERVSWANHEMRGGWSSRSWPKVDLAALCSLDSSSPSHLLHFLTLVHPFSFLFFILGREREWREWDGEWGELGFSCWEISHFLVDMWAMPHKRRTTHSHPIWYLCSPDGLSGILGGRSGESLSSPFDLGIEGYDIGVNH